MPTLLEFSQPNLLAYPKETVIAEKFEAMVKLGIANSRMKDFWDIKLMVNEFEFNGAVLQEALIATFERRHTKFPTEIPLALTDEFADDKTKQSQWSSFLRTSGIDDSSSLTGTTALLLAFFYPLIEAAGEKTKFTRLWVSHRWA